jgi:hypothetical protein
MGIGVGIRPAEFDLSFANAGARRRLSGHEVRLGKCMASVQQAYGIR